jgi:predicted nucleic acid-binding Zn finger protein
MGYKLFLDDIRTINMVYLGMDNDFVIVRSYDDCITYIIRVHSKSLTLNLG